MNCPVCTGERTTAAFYAKDIPPDEPRFQVDLCPDCGVGRTEPALPESEIGRWYPAVYYGKENVRFHWAIELLVRVFRYRRASLIRKNVPPPGPVLDVGCGRGFILSYLRSLGYQVQGVELSENAAWHARERLGLPVHAGDFKTAPFSPGSFAVAIFWHSLEHFREPFEALKHAHSLLKKGGLLVVAVPNSSSLQARLTGADWFHLDIPRHYWHFNRSALERTLARLGFKITRADHFSFEQNPYGWLQSLYNALGFKYNFLYSWIKNRSSRIVPILDHPAQSLGILLLLPVLAPLAVALTVLEACLRRGGTIELYAVKK